ncbi:MAG: hypothetical protein DRQ41_12910 [Gammaproteobacteria bacterium]|nr:MAG: hypothetical protein DRQ41_12910 [Gammaproteobacteria bacterium]RKZ73565.1 MAG: hypothetical protein DRQ57_13960 [Gammaproteobacteria bacterium]
MHTHIKAALAVTFYFVVALSIVLTFTIFYLIETGNADIEEYQTMELDRIKNALKDHVDIAYAMMDNHFKNAHDKAYLEKYYARRLTNVIDMAETVLKSKAEAVKQGKITELEAKAQAAAEISNFRYDNGEGYIWITDTNSPFPKMIMHPTEPSLDGQIIEYSKYNTALGKGQNLFVAAVEICQAHGKGFVDYLWPKKSTTGTNHEALKLAYVKLFREWNWIMGTATYVDDAGIDAMEKIKDDIRQMRYNNGMGYFWISNSTKPDLKMIVEPNMSQLEDQILENGKVKDLIKSAIEICEAKNGSGFTKKYMWPKSNTSGLTDEAKKLSYVKLHQPLGWIVGTGDYIDSLDQIIADKKARIEQQITFLIWIAVISVVVFLLISLLFRQVLAQRFSRIQSIAKSQQTPPSITPASSSVVKPQIAPVARHKVKGVTKEIPVMPQMSEQGTLRTDECIKMVQEISKTLITEQSQLLAAALHGTFPNKNANQRHEVEIVSKEHEVINESKQITDEVKQLANHTYQTIEEVKKMVEANQLPSQATNQATNTVDIAQFNKVMGNLNKMVAN